MFISLIIYRYNLYINTNILSWNIIEQNHVPRWVLEPASPVSVNRHAQSSLCIQMLIYRNEIYNIGYIHGQKLKYFFMYNTVRPKPKL